MLFYTHVLLGILFFLLFRGYFSGNILLVFLLMLLGSVLPDLDEPHSKINQWSGVLGRIISFFFKHRGMFHSLLFAGIFLILLGYFWQWPYAIALALGYLAHLLIDSITPLGVQLFYPFSRHKIRGPVRTGGAWELFLLALFIVLIIKQLFLT